MILKTSDDGHTMKISLFNEETAEEAYVYCSSEDSFNVIAVIKTAYEAGKQGLDLVEWNEKNPDIDD